jgi:CRISPR-associated protein Csb2
MILQLTIRFLDNRYHGRRDGAEPEWPPSPFRLFQAVLAGAKAQWSEDRAKAFNWLEGLPAPVIHAPTTSESSGALTYVPNNNGDDGNVSRTPKLVRPLVLNAQHRHVDYFWTYDGISSEAQSCAKTMIECVRHIRSVGWGIDMAIGHGVSISDQIPNPPDKFDVHTPSRSNIGGGAALRVPCQGSLKSLETAHENFLSRIRRNADTNKEEIYDQPGTVEFQTCVYAPSPSRPFCAFELLSPDEDEKPISFDPRRIKAIVGMMRGLFGTTRVRDAMQSIDPKCVDSMLLGHAKDPAGPRLSIMPLLSIGHQHADARVRRIILAAPFDSEGNICHLLGEMLNGQNLMPDSPDPNPIAQLRLLRSTDAYIRRWYAGSSKTWASVSPVLLPGFDLRTDKRDGKSKQTNAAKSFARAQKLAVKSLHHAGIPIPCKVEISELSWWPRVPHARNFVPREKLGPAPRYHIKLTFDQLFTGPLSLGRQRHMGLGVFAAIDS